jgi:hypothetical protein
LHPADLGESATGSPWPDMAPVFLEKRKRQVGEGLATTTCYLLDPPATTAVLVRHYDHKMPQSAYCNSRVFQLHDNQRENFYQRPKPFGGNLLVMKDSELSEQIESARPASDSRCNDASLLIRAWHGTASAERISLSSDST